MKSAFTLKSASPWWSGINILLRKGFTLIEIMVVIALMAILGLAGSAAFLSYERADRLKGEANNLKTQIRYAQNNAVSGNKVTNDAAPAGCQTTSRMLGWYINIETTDTNYQVRGICLEGFTEINFGVKNIKSTRDVRVVNIVYRGTSYTGVNILFRPLESRAHFMQNVSLPFFTTTKEVVDSTKKLGTDSLTDRLMIFLQSSSKLYLVEIFPNGEINETKI